MLDRTQIKSAIDAGGGMLRLEPSWVPRSFMIPGERLEAAPDATCTRSAATAAASTSAGSRRRPTPTTARGRPPTRGSATSGSTDGNRFLLKDAVEHGRRSAARRGGHGAREGLEPPLQVLRQHGADSPSHAPDRRAGEAPRPQGKARGVLLPAAVQQDRQQLSAHVHGARAGHDQGGRAALPRELEQGRQRHPVSLAGLPARARHRVADRSRASSMRLGRS